MSFRGRFALAYAALAVAAVGAGAVGWHAVTTHDPPAACNGPRGSADPIVTAITFLRGAVERDHPENAYRVVLASARRGVTCARWASGQIPFPRYRQIDWNRASYRRIAGGTGQIVLQVTLFSLIEHPSKATFLLELQQTGSVWQVGFFDHA